MWSNFDIQTHQHQTEPIQEHTYPNAAVVFFFTIYLSLYVKECEKVKQNDEIKC